MGYSMGTFLNIEKQYHGNQNNGSSIRMPSVASAAFLQGLTAGSTNDNIVDLLEDSDSDTSAAPARIIHSSKTKSKTETPNTALENGFMSTLINQTVDVTNVDTGEHVDSMSTAKDNLTHVYKMKKDIHGDIVHDVARAARRNNPNATPSAVANLLNGVCEFPSKKRGRPIIVPSSSNKKKAAKK